MKIAFCAIVKGSDDEAQLLSNLLDSVQDYVDGIFITITQPNELVRSVAEQHGATVSEFEWCGDFSAARNFNFSKVPKEYDYIMWGDSDDTFQNMQLLKGAMETPADAYMMWYVYDTDKYGMATAVHPKTMLVKNDGSFKWEGRLHEDLTADRQLSIFLIEDVKRIHHPTGERVFQSSQRNYGISLTEDEKDPRTWWNRANALISMSNYKPEYSQDAVSALNTFIAISNSENEQYIAYLHLGRMAQKQGSSESISYAKKAIAIHFDWPDAYFALGEFLIENKRYYEARDAIMEGLKKKPPIYSTKVYNPRDYDYNPLMLLARCYWEMGRPPLALEALRSCLLIQPDNESLQKMVEVAQEESDNYNVAMKIREKLNSYKTIGRAKKLIGTLTEDMRKHPIVNQWINTHFIKETSTGKDVVYFCGPTAEEWNPDSIKTGIGGSEEAVILLTKEWKKLGYNVTVYTKCGQEKEYDGVLWRPWWLYNPRDKQDITIFWRQLMSLDHEINSTKIYVDLHDTISAGEMLESRLAKIDKIFVKSKAHRKLYPKVPNDKFVIINNPIDISLFAETVERDQKLLINTSAPDRSLEAVCRIFRKIKERVPDVKMKWAYGWNVYDAVRKGENEIRWKNAIKEYMSVVGIEEVGRISHKEVANLYKSAKVFLYPTRFYEIDCISARKAQIGGANVVSSDFAALDETVEIGTKIHAVEPNSTNSELSDTEENDELYVEAVIAALNKENEYLEPTKHSPESIAKRWVEIWES